MLVGSDDDLPGIKGGRLPNVLKDIDVISEDRMRISINNIKLNVGQDLEIAILK